MRASLAIVPALFLAACSSSAVEPEAGTSEAEITTFDASTCPRKLRLVIGYGMSFGDIEGARAGLDEAEAKRFDAAISQFDALSEGPIVVNASNPTTTADTCTYTQAPSTTAVLRTSTAGGPELEITTGHLHLVAHPRRFAPEGIRFTEDDMVALSAVVSPPYAKGPMKLVEFGDVAVNVTGEQITRWPSLSAIRLPLLQKSLAPLSDYHAEYGGAIVIDSEKGPLRYMNYRETIQRSIDIDLLFLADPTAFQTRDPDTTMCFLGPATGVCGLASDFSGSVFTNGFEGCTATESAMTMTFKGTAITVPRCQ